LRWWRTLEHNFSRRPEGFALAMRDKVMVSATASVDVIVRTIGAIGAGSTCVPLGYNPLMLWRLRTEQELYCELADKSAAASMFKAPPTRVPIDVKRARRSPFSPRDGVVEDLRFESPFTPVNPAVRKRYLSNKRNRTAHARLWRHADGPKPTVIAIHGFGAEQSWVNEFMLALPRLYKLGCDVMLMTLPFHGPRQSRLSPFSGHGFFSGGLCGINEAFAQAVMDARVFIDHLLLDRGAPAVGVTGISLGGLTTALLAVAEPRLAFAVPNVPVVTLADLVLEWRPLGEFVRLLMRVTGLGIKDIRHILAASSPLTYPPAVARDRLMIIAGVGDRMAPPKHSRLLWEHWQRCRLHWFPGGHLLHLDRGEYLDEMARFMADVGFLPRS